MKAGIKEKIAMAVLILVIYWLLVYVLCHYQYSKAYSDGYQEGYKKTENCAEYDTKQIDKLIENMTFLTNVIGLQLKYESEIRK